MKHVTLLSLLLLSVSLLVGINTAPVSAAGEQWQISYYNNSNHAGNPVMSLEAEAIDFNWGNGSPASWNVIRPDNFSARFSRTLNLSSPTAVTINAAGDDNMRVYVNGREVLNAGPSGASTTLQLQAGTHEVRGDYRETTGNASARLSVSGASKPVPAAPGIQHDIPGLVAYYPFEEQTGRDVLDAARGNHGFLIGNLPRINSGGIGRGVQAQGGLGIRLPQSAENAIGTSDFTVSVWIKTNQSQRLRVIYDKRVFRSTVSRGYVTGHHMFLFDGKLGFQMADGKGNSPFCGADNPTCTNYITKNPRGFVADGQWHMVTIAADRDSTTGLRFYIDGSLIDRFDITGRQGSINSNGSDAMDWTFGPSGNPFGLDEIRLYNRSLSQQEIGQLFWKRN
ncbi:MAG: LamG-like jellyroll fold domain-containing protein [Candidatus Promineifilaceae bacterium]